MHIGIIIGIVVVVIIIIAVIIYFVSSGDDDGESKKDNKKRDTSAIVNDIVNNTIDIVAPDISDKTDYSSKSTRWLVGAAITPGRTNELYKRMLIEEALIKTTGYTPVINGSTNYNLADIAATYKQKDFNESEDHLIPYTSLEPIPGFQTPKDTAIEQALAETYGFMTSYPQATCHGEPCAYGFTFNIDSNRCKEMGGRWNVTPNGIADCNVNVGRNPSWGISGPDVCPTHIAKIEVLGKTCRDIGGIPENPNLADDAWGGRCTVSICPPKTSKYMLNKSSTPGALGQLRMIARNATDCANIGGAYNGSGEWGVCDMAIIPTPKLD